MELLKKLKSKYMFNNEDDRMRRILITAITTAISRGLSILVPLIVVRISLNKLGTETYGLWMTVTSFFTIFTFADLGLGSGLQTRLSRLYGSNNRKESQILISSTFIVLSLITILILIIFFAFFVNVDWIKLMNAKSEKTIEVVGYVVLAIVISKISNIPLGLVQRVQFAFQEGYISNIWNCASSILSLVTVYILSKLNIAPISIIWGSAFSPIFVSILNYFSYFYMENPELKPNIKLFDKKEANSILRIGISFMLLSILTTLGLSMDSYIVGRNYGLDSVTPYSIGYRIATVMGVATSMLSMPLWSANGEALANKEFLWIKKTTQKMSLISLGITILGSLIFLVFGNELIKLWLNNDLNISFLLMSGLLFMQIIQSYISPYFMVLNGAGIVKKQIYMFLLYTPISIVLKYILSVYFEVSIIPWTGAFLYALLIAIPTYIMARNVYNKRSKG